MTLESIAMADAIYGGGSHLLRLDALQILDLERCAHLRSIGHLVCWTESWFSAFQLERLSQPHHQRSYVAVSVGGEVGDTGN